MFWLHRECWEIFDISLCMTYICSVFFPALPFRPVSFHWFHLLYWLHLVYLSVCPLLSYLKAEIETDTLQKVAFGCIIVHCCLHSSLITFIVYPFFFGYQNQRKKKKKNTCHKLAFLVFWWLLCPLSTVSINILFGINAKWMNFWIKILAF